MTSLVNFFYSLLLLVVIPATVALIFISQKDKIQFLKPSRFDARGARRPRPLPIQNTENSVVVLA